MKSDLAGQLGRRQFLARTTALASAMVGTSFSLAAAAQPLRGLYPIAWTPCTPDNRLDLHYLAAQVTFCQRGRVAGLVWPQNASAWTTLSEQEWMDGSRTLLSAARGGATEIVIGVQTVGADIEKSVRYAKSAAANGADAIISLPPENASDEQIVAYYRTLGEATPLPLMVQAVGNVSVDLIGRLFQQVPTLKAVKDEAGNPLARAPQILARTNGKLADFSGGGGRNMLTEMALGFSGCCPYVGLADLYQQCFDLWHAGRRKDAFDMFGRISAFNSIPGSNEYVLVARGVFPETAIMRKNSGARNAESLDASQKTFIREALDEFLKPYLRA